MTNVERITAALQAYMKAEMPEELRKAMEYSLLAGGKRLRPMLCLSACEMAGGQLEAALPLACALEMIHTYSLIHDDLPCMDDDDFRRGRPSNHKVFGEANALLAGDGLLSIAAEIARGAGVNGMVAGQWKDLANEKNPSADAATLTDIHTRKTGALITAAVLAGGLAGKADAAEMKALRAFGAHFGVLFQITDDLLDVEGDEKTVGKTLGKDAAHEKLTYPALYGVPASRRMAEEEARLAEDALAPFGERAAWFIELTEQTLTRTF